jgi:predicted CoA-binding protein
MDCVTGVLQADSIYCETRRWKDKDSVRPTETALPKSHGVTNGASRLNLGGTSRVNQYMSLNVTGKEQLGMLSAHKWAVVGDVTNLSSHAFRITHTLRSKQKVVHRVDPSLEEDKGSCKCSLLAIEDDVDAVCLCINPTPFGNLVINEIIQRGIKTVFIQETHFWTLRKGSALLTKCQANGLQVHRGNMLLEYT